MTLIGSWRGRFEPALKLLAGRQIRVTDIIDEGMRRRPRSIMQPEGRAEGGAPSMKLTPQLEQIRIQAEEIDKRAAALCAGLRESELAWRSDPGRWSIAENLLHLRLTTMTFLPAVDRAIADARSRNLVGEGPFAPGWFGRVFAWYVEPPPKLKAPAPKVIRPILTGPAVDVLPQFLESQKLMLARLEAANGLDLGAARVNSPLASFVKMSLLSLFQVWTGHSRRHLWQASKVRERISDAGL